MEEVIKELFGPDPFFIQLVSEHVKEYRKKFPRLDETMFENMTINELKEIASSKDVCDEFLKCLMKKETGINFIHQQI